MPGLRYADVARKPTDVLDMTSLTVDEFQALLPSFEQAFQAHMAEWRLDGKPRTARRYTTYTNCPLPTPEDRLLFILVYLKTNPLQVAHGLMFGLPQGKTNQWLHLLLPLVRQTLRELGDAPSRTLKELAQRLALGVAEVEQATAALFAMTEPNDPSRAPKTRLNRKASIAARRKAIG
jgi:Helix-turn-helix of DDE superfamily endonuclease